MLAETKLAMGMTTDANDAELASLLMAAAEDLKIAGVTLGGRVTFTVQNDKIVENCTVTSELVKRALITYVRKNFRNPPNYVQLAESYDLQRKQLANATGFTNWT